MTPIIWVLAPQTQALEHVLSHLERAQFTVRPYRDSEVTGNPLIVLADLTSDAQAQLATLKQISQEHPLSNVIFLLITDDETFRDAFPLMSTTHTLLWHVSEPPELLAQRLRACLQRRATFQRQMRTQAMRPLYRIAQAFTNLSNLEDLLQNILETAIQETDADRGSIMLLDEGSQTLYIAAAVGLPQDVVRHHRQKVGEGIAGWVAENRRPLILTEGEIPPFVLPWLRGRNAYSSVSVPLLHQGTLVGVLNLTKKPGKVPFMEGDTEFITILATQAAAAIRNAKLFTQIQEAYHQLRQLDQLRTQIIDIAAHELRTPVSVLKGYVELLEEMDLPQLTPFLPPIVRSVRQLERLARDLFDLSTLHALGRAPEPEEVEVEPWLTEVLEKHRSLAAQRQITLTHHVAPAARVALFDPKHVEVILRHLLQNALTFTPAKGRVHVSVERVANDLIFHVDDSGPGIPPEERKRIFQSFYQIEAVETRQHGGLGIGLTLARTLAHTHHGTLEVGDSPLGGARFSLHLPQPVEEDFSHPSP